MKRIILAIFLLAFSLPTFAQNIAFGDRGERAKVVHLVQLTSYDNESKEEFLGRVGRFLTNFTTNNNYEGCASICSVPGQNKWGVRVQTNESVLACLVTDQCPSEMVQTGESIHSHPNIGQHRLTVADEQFLRARKDRHKSRVFSVSRYGGFSDIDKTHGAGYLVENAQLLFFNGKETKVVGPVATNVLRPAQ